MEEVIECALKGDTEALVAMSHPAHSFLAAMRLAVFFCDVPEALVFCLFHSVLCDETSKSYEPKWAFPLLSW